jgi:hypothetical protein
MEIIKLINQRCAERIREAHRIADEQCKYVRFIEQEVANGADLMTAVTTAFACWPDLTFLEEITNLIEKAGAQC